MRILDLEVNKELAAELGLSPNEFQRIVEASEEQPGLLDLMLYAHFWSEYISYKHVWHWLKTLRRESKWTEPAKDWNKGQVLQFEKNLALQMVAACSRENFGLAPSFLFADSINSAQAKHGDKKTKSLVQGLALSLGNQSKSEIDGQNTLFFKRMTQAVNANGVPAFGAEVKVDGAYSQAPAFSYFSLAVLPEKSSLKTETLSEQSIYWIRPAQQGHRSTEPLNAKELVQTFLRQRELFSTTANQVYLSGFQSDLNKLGLSFEWAQIDERGLIYALYKLTDRIAKGAILNLEKIASSLAVGVLEIFQSTGTLLVLEDEQLDQELLHKWGLEASEIADFSDEPNIKLRHKGNELAKIPLNDLHPGNGAPVYQPQMQKPKYFEKASKFSIKRVPDRQNYIKVARKILQENSRALSRDLQATLDPFQGALATNLNQLSDGVNFRLPKGEALGIWVQQSGSAYLETDPFSGAAITVAQTLRKIACSGGLPLGISFTLHMGNPNTPLTYWSFMQTIRGINECCSRFGISVLHADVSLNNHSINKNGMQDIPFFLSVAGIGKLDASRRQIPMGFEQEGDQIYMLGTPQNDINSSVYLKCAHGKHRCMAPVFDLDEEYHIHHHMRNLFRKELLVTAHGIQEGGLFTALLEAAKAGATGFDIESDPNFRKDAYLFGEAQNRVLVTVRLEREDELVNYLNAQNVPFTRLGEVLDQEISIDGDDFGTLKEWITFVENSN